MRERKKVYPADTAEFVDNFVQHSIEISGGAKEKLALLNMNEMEKIYEPNYLPPMSCFDILNTSDRDKKAHIGS